MNKTKFIPFLALVAMLSACTLGNGSTKMKKYSKEVSFEDWNTGINEALNSDAMGGDVAQDIETVTNISMKMSEKTTRDGKAIEEEKTNASGTMKTKYDADTDVAYSEASIKGTAKYNEGSSTMTYDASGSLKRYYQKMTVKEEVDGVEQDVEKTVSVNTKQKEYYVQTSNVQSMAMQYVAGPVLALAFLPMSYEYASEEEKANYKFYQDGQMFTAVYSETKEQDYTMNVNEETVTYRHDVTVTTDTIQLECKKSGEKVTSFTVRYEQKKEVTRTYLVNYSSSCLKDDVKTESQDMIYISTISLKKADLKAIDLKGYIDGGEDADIDLGD